MNEPEQFIVDLIEANKGTILSFPSRNTELEFTGSAFVSGVVGYFFRLEPQQGLRHRITIRIPGEAFPTADNTVLTADTTALRADIFIT